MPYDNAYNRRLASQLHDYNDRYAKLYSYSPVDGQSGLCGGAAGVLFQMGNASKRDGHDNQYNDDLELPEVYYEGNSVGGNAFAKGTFRDTGVGRVDGATGHFDKISGRGMSGGLRVGDLGNKDFWNNIRIEGGGFSLGDLGNMDFWNNIRVGGGMSGGFRLGDLGNMDFWNNIRVEGGGMSGGFRLADLGNKDFWNNIRIEGGGGVSVGELLDSDFWKKLQVGHGMSGGGWDDFTNFFKNAGKEIVKVADKSVEGLNSGYNAAKGVVGLGGLDNYFKNLGQQANANSAQGRMSGGFKIWELATPKFWGGFKMSDLGNPEFWKNISVGPGLHTPHHKGGFSLGDLGDADFWKSIKVESGSGHSGGGYSAGAINFKDLTNPDWWASVSIKEGSGAPYHKEMVGGFKVGDLLNPNWWKLLPASVQEFLFNKLLLGRGEYGLDKLEYLFNKNLDMTKFMGPYGNGPSGGAILGNPDPYPVKGNSKRIAGRGRKPDQKILADRKAVGKPDQEMLASGMKTAVINPRVELQGPNGDLLAMPDSVLKNGVPPKAQLRGSYGGAKPDGRQKRAQIVKRVMAEQGINMIAASKFVKQHNLY